jgi:hypothetical protein
MKLPSLNFNVKYSKKIVKKSKKKCSHFILQTGVEGFACQVIESKGWILFGIGMGRVF